MSATATPATPATEGRKMVSLNVFKEFKETGDEIEGHYMGFIREPGLNERGKQFIGQHAILTEQGVERFNETVQLRVLETLPSGVFVRVVLTGAVGNQHGGKTKLFDVQIDGDDFSRVKALMAHNATLQMIGGSSVDVATGEVTEGAQDPFRG